MWLIANDFWGTLKRVQWTIIVRTCNSPSEQLIWEPQETVHNWDVQPHSPVRILSVIIAGISSSSQNVEAPLSLSTMFLMDKPAGCKRTFSQTVFHGVLVHTTCLIPANFTVLLF